MSTRFEHLPTTEEHPLTTDVDGAEIGPRLLVAFPKPIALTIPRSGEIVGRAWLDEHGIVDSKVSREHVSFSRKGGQLQITDHGSQNGTFVMGKQLEPHVPIQIEDGFIFRLGQTVFVYREAFPVRIKPQPPLGKLVAPWGLHKIREELYARTYRPGLNVLLEGPTGTGKELLAEEVARRLRPGTKFVPMNLAAVPRDHFEGNMFGWEKHSFTGAFQTNTGYLRAATGGTVFLDEIEALPLELQPKLLRFLENRQVQPLGARDASPTVDCLVIAATNRTISELLTKDAFRRDVIARFQLRLSLPTLEDRPEDLYAILASRWESTHGKLDLGATRVDAEAIDRLMRHDWLDNVRELFRLVDTLDPKVGIKKSAVDRILGPESRVSQFIGSGLITADTVAQAMATCGGNQSHAAKWLGVSRSQLLRWIRKNGQGLEG